MLYPLSYRGRDGSGYPDLRMPRSLRRVCSWRWSGLWGQLPRTGVIVDCYRPDCLLADRSEHEISKRRTVPDAYDP